MIFCFRLSQNFVRYLIHFNVFDSSPFCFFSVAFDSVCWAKYWILNFYKKIFRRILRKKTALCSAVVFMWFHFIGISFINRLIIFIHAAKEKNWKYGYLLNNRRTIVEYQWINTNLKIPFVKSDEMRSKRRIKTAARRMIDKLLNHFELERRENLKSDY